MTKELLELAAKAIKLAGKYNSCFTCKHRHSHREIESWELPHIFWWIHSCDARPVIANLKQFPFKNTNCKEWIPNDNQTRS